MAYATEAQVPHLAIFDARVPGCIFSTTLSLVRWGISSYSLGTSSIHFIGRHWSRLDSGFPRGDDADEAAIESIASLTHLALVM
jgi:hypothetical protein